MSEGVRPCDACPLESSLHVADNFIDNVAHNDRLRAKGGIALTGGILTELLKTVDCPGPQINRNGQLTCALEGTVMMTRSLATGPWPNSSFLVDLVELSPDNENTQVAMPGQYL